MSSVCTPVRRLVAQQEVDNTRKQAEHDEKLEGKAWLSRDRIMYQEKKEGAS